MLLVYSSTYSQMRTVQVVRLNRSVSVIDHDHICYISQQGEFLSVASLHLPIIVGLRASVCRMLDIEAAS